MKKKEMQMTLFGRILLKYSKSSAPTKSMLAMFTEAWQYCTKNHKRVSYGNYMKASASQNKFLKYPLRSNVKLSRKM